MTPHVHGGAALGAAVTGTWLGALQMSLSWLVWGVFVRTVAVWHVTWSVNSITHIWGYRNFQTRDDSRNNLLVVLVSNGEGWHNNHHAQPRAAAHGVRWWELDELRAVEIEVFPAGLVDLVAALVPGWDGVTRHLGLAREV